jgi:hypothetical protein
LASIAPNRRAAHAMGMAPARAIAMHFGLPLHPSSDLQHPKLTIIRRSSIFPPRPLLDSHNCRVYLSSRRLALSQRKC